MGLFPGFACFPRMQADVSPCTIKECFTDVCDVPRCVMLQAGTQLVPQYSALDPPGIVMQGGEAPSYPFQWAWGLQQIIGQQLVQFTLSFDLIPDGLGGKLFASKFEVYRELLLPPFSTLGNEHWDQIEFRHSKADLVQMDACTQVFDPDNPCQTIGPIQWMFIPSCMGACLPPAEWPSA